MADYEHDGNIFTGIEDEFREHREYQKNYYSGGGGTEPQGCGCLSTIVTAVVLGTLWWLVEKIFF